VKLARQAEAGMCADDHSLDMMQTHLIRDSIQSATVTEETVSSIEHLLNNARLRCGDRLNIADAQFLGGLYEQLAERTLAASLYSESSREFAAAIAIYSKSPGPNLPRLWALRGQVQAEAGLGNRNAADLLLKEQERLARKWSNNKEFPKFELRRTLEFVAQMNDKEGNHAAAARLLREARSLDGN
jgi:hypothetical protein